jgi:hypothetical protein
MKIARRRLLHALAVGGVVDTAGSAEAPKPTLDTLRAVAMVHGANLSDERLEVLRPVLERRLAQLETLRSFEVDDSVGLDHGSV